MKSEPINTSTPCWYKVDRNKFRKMLPTFIILNDGDVVEVSLGKIEIICASRLNPKKQLKLKFTNEKELTNGVTENAIIAPEWYSYTPQLFFTKNQIYYIIEKIKEILIKKDDNNLCEGCVFSHLKKLQLSCNDWYEKKATE